MDENKNYWEDLTDQLLSAGQNYFTGQQNQATQITLQKINAETIISVVKFVALVFGIAMVVKAIFGFLFKRSR